MITMIIETQYTDGNDLWNTITSFNGRNMANIGKIIDVRLSFLIWSWV